MMSSPGMSSAGGGKAQKRADVRKAVQHSAVLHYKGTQIPVVLQDMSRNGVRIGLNASRAGLVLEGPAFLAMPGGMRLPLNIRWQKNTVFGAAFDLPVARKASYHMQIENVIGRARR